MMKHTLRDILEGSDPQFLYGVISRFPFNSFETRTQKSEVAQLLGKFGLKKAGCYLIANCDSCISEPPDSYKNS